MEHTFSIQESLRYGWEQTRKHSGLLFKVLLTIFAVQVAQAVVGKVLEATLVGVLATLALTIVGFVVGAGLTLITLNIAKGKEVTYAQIAPPGKILWKYFLASLVAGLITVGGFILLIIPGIYFALRFAFVSFAALEGGGVKESLRKSSQITRGIKWHLFGFWLVMILLNILGALLLLMGLLVTVPVTLIAYAHIYQKLESKAS